MKEINFRDTDEKIINDILSSEYSDTLTADIIGLTSNGKHKVRVFIHTTLKKYNLECFTIDTTDIIFELLFNAIKALYSHVLTITNLKMLHPEFLQFIKDSSYLYNSKMMQKYNEIQADPINRAEVKEIMQLEGRLFNDLDHNNFSNVYKFKRLRFFKDCGLKNNAIKIRFEYKDDFVIFSILNEAPITYYAISRIREKRTTFREYYNNNKVDKFFIERLDNTESAGFGIALIDLRLLTLGLEPEKHFRVIDDKNGTLSMLKLPIKYK